MYIKNNKKNYIYIYISGIEMPRVVPGSLQGYEPNHFMTDLLTYSLYLFPYFQGGL